MNFPWRVEEFGSSPGGAGGRGDLPHLLAHAEERGPRGGPEDYREFRFSDWSSEP